MKIKVQYRMSAYIKADTLEQCHQIWDNVDLTLDKQKGDGHIGTEYDELLEVYDADTLEEIEHKNW